MGRVPSGDEEPLQVANRTIEARCHRRHFTALIFLPMVSGTSARLSWSGQVIGDLLHGLDLHGDVEPVENVGWAPASPAAGA